LRCEAEEIKKVLLISEGLNILRKASSLKLHACLISINHYSLRRAIWSYTITVMIAVVIAAVSSEFTMIPAITLIFVFSPVAMFSAESFIFIGPPFPASIITVSATLIITVIHICPARDHYLALDGKMRSAIVPGILRLRNSNQEESGCDQDWKFCFHKTNFKVNKSLHL
jgi:hypothetical protein